MRPAILIAGLLVFGALTRTAATTPQATPSSAGPAGTATMTIDALAFRVMQAEAALTARMKAFRPIVEVYAQHVESRAPLGSVPVGDEYFLGQFDWTDLEGPKMTRLTREGGQRQMTDWLTQPFRLQLNFDGFAAMTVPDWRLLDGRHHAFTYLRREFLGDVRCLVFDVAPRVDSTGFSGRIWVEERDFNIVRFNGVTRGPASGRTLLFSVDSWRANVRPGLWLPSYVYSELQSDEGPRMKSHVRLWGYYLKSYRSPQEVTATSVGDKRAVENVLERLAQAGLLAPPGEVDKVLSTVINNLQITNNLTIASLKTRVLLTSPLESFSVGRTVVLSRGLIDVLPDEASLATMLAHELAHIILGHDAIDPQFASADKLMIPDDTLLATVVPRHTLEKEEAADRLMVDLLKNSPYKDKLAEAGLFLRTVSENSKKLTNLVRPHIGEYARVTQWPVLSPERLDEVAALPLGARVVVDPWTGRVELVRTANVPPASAREKGSLSVTPLVPYLRYFDARPQADIKQ